MKKFYLLVALCYFSLGTSAQSLIYSDTIPVVDIRISPEHAMGGTVSDWIEGLTFIPLKGDNKQLIAKVKEINAHNGRIGIISAGDAEDAFLLYETNGTLLYMNTVKEMELPSSPLNMFDIKVWNDQFLFSTPRYTLRLDSDFRVDTISENPNDAYITDSIKLRNVIWYSSSPDSPSKTRGALRKDETILLKYGNERGMFSHGKLSNVDSSGSHAYAAFRYHYKLFHLNENGISKIFNFILPLKSTIDTSVVLNLSSQEEYSQYNDEREHVIDGFSDIIIHQDLVLLKLYSWEYEWLAFNSKTQEFVNLNNIIPDTSNDFIEFLSPDISTDGEFLYSYIYPNRIRNAMEKCKEEGHSMRPEYQALAKHNNPIVVRFKLK